MGRCLTAFECQIRFSSEGSGLARNTRQTILTVWTPTPCGLWDDLAYQVRLKVLPRPLEPPELSELVRPKGQRQPLLQLEAVGYGVVSCRFAASTVSTILVFWMQIHG